ncbi:NADPH-dependent FMN reductase [Micrococcus porci]|uniref:NADPH-dependent FMN reductase n=1 Tax=Micrococcus porci TaxID=2856555 RepID=UPI003CE8A81A
MKESTTPTVAVIVASSRQNRVGRTIADAVADLARETLRADVEILDLRDVDLPFYDEPFQLVAYGWHGGHTVAEQLPTVIGRLKGELVEPFVNVTADGAVRDDDGQIADPAALVGRHRDELQRGFEAVQAHLEALETGAGRWFARRAPAHGVLRPGTWGGLEIADGMVTFTPDSPSDAPGRSGRGRPSCTRPSR